ncbi:hypothetical protein HOA92_05235 [archaeon]|jgi:thymidylate kinase|nr:hypothetical protein [archaeon]MBT6762418.1 hypothetical protein [archaeon]
MVKLICFEGAHGSGKGTLIDFFLKELEAKSVGSYSVIRDSEFPEFEVVKRNIRSGTLSDRQEIITTVAETRALIYERHINPLLRTLDFALLDRSYHTSAVWQSRSFDEMLGVITENERRGIPRADLTLILHAPTEVIRARLESRGRADLSEHSFAQTMSDQEKYLYLADNLDGCVAINTNREPAVLARKIYNLIFANSAL